MTGRDLVPQAAVAGSTAAISAGVEPFISLALGLLGVFLARIAFTTRQQRMGERVSLTETIVITFMAMILVGPLVWEHKLGMTTSAMVGLGSGWASIALFDAIGERIVDMIIRLTGGTPRQRPEDPPSSDPRPDPRPPFGGRVVASSPEEIDLLESIDHAQQRAEHAIVRDQRRNP